MIGAALIFIGGLGGERFGDVYVDAPAAVAEDKEEWNEKLLRQD